jgi:uncharacterized protein CbrC (UPF0167 family)
MPRFSDKDCTSQAHNRITMDPLLPTFRYHPDPIAAGSVNESMTTCRACGLARGAIYTGPVFSTAEIGDEICPWCVADGTAAARFEAEFTDTSWGVPNDVPDEVRVEIATRTPGFVGWQQSRWLYHCADGAAFLGPAGFDELRSHSDAIDMLLHENDEFGWTAEQSRAHVEALHRDGEATGYLFKCLRCGRHLAYSDMS